MCILGLKKSHGTERRLPLTSSSSSRLKPAKSSLIASSMQRTAPQADLLEAMVPGEHLCITLPTTLNTVRFYLKRALRVHWN